MPHNETHPCIPPDRAIPKEDKGGFDSLPVVNLNLITNLWLPQWHTYWLRTGLLYSNVLQQHNIVHVCGNHDGLPDMFRIDETH